MNNMVIKEAILAASESSGGKLITQMARKKNISDYKRNSNQKSTQTIEEMSSNDQEKNVEKSKKAEAKPKTINLQAPGKSNIISKMGG